MLKTGKSIVRTLAMGLCLPVLALFMAGCASTPAHRYGHRLYISVPDQKMVVMKETPDPETKGVKLLYVTEYPVSTSKFGVGSLPNSNCTPLGKHIIAKKIGTGVPLYTKFHNRRPTGEIVRPDTPGRDPIVTRILWLKGMEAQNANSFGRYIYIHGTAEEAKIGRPASFGCIRMKSTHVAQLYALVDEKDEVYIINKHLNPAAYLPPPGTPSMAPVPAGTPGTPAAYMGPAQATAPVRSKLKPNPSALAPATVAPNPLPASNAQKPVTQPGQFAMASPDPNANGGGAVLGSNPNWVPADRKVAKYYRKGVNPKRIFE